MLELSLKIIKMQVFDSPSYTVLAYNMLFLTWSNRKLCRWRNSIMLLNQRHMFDSLRMTYSSYRLRFRHNQTYFSGNSFCMSQSLNLQLPVGHQAWYSMFKVAKWVSMLQKFWHPKVSRIPCSDHIGRFYYMYSRQQMISDSVALQGNRLWTQL